MKWAIIIKKRLNAEKNYTKEKVRNKAQNKKIL